MLKRIAATVALAGTLAANASAQVIDSLADSLSANTILEMIAREAASGRSETGAATAERIRKATISSWRADSLLAGLRDIALSDGTPDVRIVAVSTIAASGSQHGQGVILLELFDSVPDSRTRAIILNTARILPDTTLRRAVITRALQLRGDRSSEFIVGLAVLTAIRMGDAGVGALQRALEDGIIKDERTQLLIDAAIADYRAHRDRR